MQSEYHGNTAEIKLDHKNFVKASLRFGQKILTLIDSGASKSIINASTIASSKYLRNIKPIQVKPVQFRLGNGQSLFANKALKFQINIQSHKFTIVAHIAENLTGIDLILGTTTLGELNASLDFATNTFKIRQKSLPLKAIHSVTLKPGQTKTIALYCEHQPSSKTPT